MTRRWLVTLAATAWIALPLAAQEGIRLGQIKRVDAERGVIAITAGGKDQEFVVLPQTRIVGPTNQDLRRGIRDEALKPGTDVMFKAAARGGRNALVALKLALPRVDTSRLKPLTELGTGPYQGFTGGLYPGGRNERPAAHEAAGRARARQVQPLDGDGRPAADGKIVLLAVGMSNTAQSWQGFQIVRAGKAGINPRLILVNGAQGGTTAQAIQDPEDQGRGTTYWTTVDQRLQAAGATRSQVQAVWIKQADAGPTQGFPGYARKLEAELTRIVQVLPRRFPNVQLAYLSSRTYGGYARTPLNPEPYAYESGFAVKWLIERQIAGDPALNDDPQKGPVTAPWLSWGPYLWANGTARRSDGFFYQESDFGADGTHQSPSGQEKVGRLLLQFFTTDTTTTPWFLHTVR